MWLLGESVTVSNNVAEVVGIVAKHVVDLTCSIGLVLRAFDSRIGRLNVEGYKKQHRYIYMALQWRPSTHPETNEGKVGSISVRTPLRAERLTPRRLLNCHCCIAESLNIGLVPESLIFIQFVLFFGGLMLKHSPIFSCQLKKQKLGSWQLVGPVKGPRGPCLGPWEVDQ